MEERPIRTIIGEQKPVSAGAETSVAAAAKLMKRHRIGALLVIKSGRLAGIFTERDALGPDLQRFVADLGMRNHIGEILG